MTDIWDRENLPISIKDVWDHDPESHSWLDALRGKYLNLTDYERWWMELRDLLSGYLVDCNDSDIIFSQLKDWKENSNLWEALPYKVRLWFSDYLKDITSTDKLEAVKNLFNELPASTISHLCSVLYPINKLDGMNVYTNHTLYNEFKRILEGE